MTFEYVKGRPFANLNFAKSVDKWRKLYSDDNAIFDQSVIELDVSNIRTTSDMGN
ncbi:hypothetical protein ACVXZZ_02450 [Staphylococcus aureus]